MSLHKYHYFYKITNLINNKYYYGIHSTNDLDDGYMGSGKALKKAIKKYGVENFSKDILKFFSSIEELSDFEKTIVTEELVNDPNCYNLTTGGYFLSDEDILKLKKSICGSQSGEKNSSYGKRWVKKGDQTIRINKEEIDEYIQSGWVPGRNIRTTPKMIKANKNRTWIWKDGQTKFINIHSIQNYLNDGWTIGRTEPRPKKEKRPKGWNLKHINASYILVQDISGNKLYVRIDDPRYLSGELVSFNKGKVSVEDADGNKLYVRIDDPRYLSGELVPIQKKYSNFVLVKDNRGNYFKVPKDDPRYLSGELIPITTGRLRSDEEKKKISLSKSGKTWVNNGNIHKYIACDLIDEFLSNNPDWSKGRIKDKKSKSKN